MSNPDFVMLAKSMHVHSLRVTNSGDLQQKMKEFLEYDNSKPVLMECLVEPDEHVFPMVRRFVLILVFVSLTMIFHCRYLQGKHCINKFCTLLS